jgi:hypothetical protein
MLDGAITPAIWAASSSCSVAAVTPTPGGVFVRSGRYAEKSYRYAQI